MNSITLVAVVVITTGDSPNFLQTSRQWCAEGYVPGRTLFFCGLSSKLLEQGMDSTSIIEYVDPPYYRNNFHINDKKRKACEAIDAKYIYLVHDRFFPQVGFRETLNRALADEKVDFGAVDVDNPDGTPALRELRLRRKAASSDLESALYLLGRLACKASEPEASSNIAVNGGQFFLRKSMIEHLKRPMRWMEMEDDVLSHDLRAARGRWIEGCVLTTLAPRLAPDVDLAAGTQLKYMAYRTICNLLAALTGSISVGQRLDRQQLEQCLCQQFLLIDPLHKLASSEFLPSSLEKLMTRARIASDGKCWVRVDKHRLGWKLTGPQGNI